MRHKIIKSTCAVLIILAFTPWIIGWISKEIILNNLQTFAQQNNYQASINKYFVGWLRSTGEITLTPRLNIENRHTAPILQIAFSLAHGRLLLNHLNIHLLLAQFNLDHQTLFQQINVFFNRPLFKQFNPLTVDISWRNPAFDTDTNDYYVDAHIKVNKINEEAEGVEITAAVSIAQQQTNCLESSMSMKIPSSPFYGTSAVTDYYQLIPQLYTAKINMVTKLSQHKALALISYYTRLSLLLQKELFNKNIPDNLANYSNQYARQTLQYLLKQNLLIAKNNDYYFEYHSYIFKNIADNLVRYISKK